jgi:predicted regulator of Ras-like GTPase activity (Roadblock/LC7/MglB family)
MNDVILRQEDIDRFTAILSRLAYKARLLLTILVHKDGHLLSAHGSQTADTTALAALISANFSSTMAIANVIGEKEFRTQFHRGKVKNVFVALVDDNSYLVAVFDDQTTIDIVRVYTEEYTEELGKALQLCYNNTADDLDLGSDDLSMLSEKPEQAAPTPKAPVAPPAQPQQPSPVAQPAPRVQQQPAAPVEQPAPPMQPASPPTPAGPSVLAPVQPRVLEHTVRPSTKPAPEKPVYAPAMSDELQKAAASISSRHASEIQYNPAKKVTEKPSVSSNYLKKKAHEVRSSEEMKSNKGGILSHMFGKQKSDE